MASNLTSWLGENAPERGTVIAVSLASAVLYYIATVFFTWHRLSHFAGPPIASISYLWGFLVVVSGQCQHLVPKAQDKYGKVVRIGPDALMISDPDVFRRISSARSTYDRGGWYASMQFHPEGDSVLSEMNTARHDKRKAKLITGFNGKGEMNHEVDIDSQMAALVNYIKRKVRDGQGHSLDFSTIARWFQLDLITLVGMGEAWGDLADETDHYDFLTTMDAAIPFIHSVCMVPLLRKLVFSKLFLFFAAPRVTDKKGMGRSMNMMRSTVKARSESNVELKVGRKHGGMLDEWLKHGLTPEQCEWDLAVQMPAGTETSITSIRGTLLHLLTSPRVYQKLKQEISDGIKEGRISKPITNEQAKALPYLQAVIVEGMRMVPPVISGFSKKVPTGGDTIDGKFIPEGTDIHMNFLSMMKDTKEFGPDAAVFRPERFLECDAATKARMLKTVDLCFGHGRWLCLGKSLALIELNKIYVELFRAFDLQIANAEQPWKRKGYSVSVIDDFNLQISENSLDD